MVTELSQKDMQKSLAEAASLFNEQKWEKFISEYTKLLQAMEEDASISSDVKVRAYANRGAAYGNLGKFDCAVRDFRKALELSSKFLELSSKSGRMQNTLKQNVLMQNALLNSHLARTYVAKGEPDKAKKFLNVAQELATNA